ncbi:MAG: HEAT repeat domain-containing protein, partial [Thermodesulfobacteriota bacterium]
DTTDREFREAVTTSLSKILCRQPEQIPGLITQIPASKTRKLGMSWLLGKTQQPGAIRFLAELLKDPDPDVRASAIGALAKFKDKPLFEYLKQMIYDPNERVRAAAVNAMSVAGDMKAFEIVKSGLEDIDGFVRKRAAVGLARIDLEKALVEMEKRRTRFAEIDSSLRGVTCAAGKLLDPSVGEDPVARNVITELCPEEDLLRELKSSPKEERRLHAFRILAAVHRHNPRNLNAIVKNDPSAMLREEAKTLLAGQ